MPCTALRKLVNWSALVGSHHEETARPTRGASHGETVSSEKGDGAEDEDVTWPSCPGRGKGLLVLIVIKAHVPFCS